MIKYFKNLIKKYQTPMIDLKVGEVYIFTRYHANIKIKYVGTLSEKSNVKIKTFWMTQFELGYNKKRKSRNAKVFCGPLDILAQDLTYHIISDNAIKKWIIK